MNRSITKKRLTLLSLFSGARGLDLGLEKAGFTTLACVENEKNCLGTIRMNRPDIRLYEDIVDVSPFQIMNDLGVEPGELDLVAGGPPCQAFSTAGKRESLHDFRGNMIVKYLEYIKVIRPKYFILENVRGLLSAKLANTPSEYSEYSSLEDIPGSVLYFLNQEFKKLGYSVSFSLFDASFYNVPQKRERVIMFGAYSKNEVTIPVPFTKESPLTLKQAIGDIQGKSSDFIKLRETHLKYLKLLKGGEYWKNLPRNLQQEAMGKSYYLQGGKTGFYRRLSWDKPAPTLVTHPAMPATMLVHPEELRPLSIQEYARIQQFPDDWVFFGTPIKVYKQIGNAVPVGLGFVAGRAIISHMEGELMGNLVVPQTSRYNGTSHLEFLANFIGKHIDKLELRSHIQLNSRVSFEKEMVTI